MLSFRQIIKKYSNHIILNNIDLDFIPGNLYILTGDNGSGKSTIIKIISGMIYKNKGEIEKDGLISYLPDKFNMPKLMKVKNYLSYILPPDIKTDLLMFKYKIPNKRIGSLSKGNYQKLGILQVLNTKALYYVLDEPFDGLDEYGKELLIKEIEYKLKSGNSFIISLHDKDLLQNLNPITIKIKDGLAYYGA